MTTIESPAYQFALSAAVDTAAPAVAGGTIDVEASREVVWDALAHVENWPSIRADISDVVASGPPTEGSTFTWSAGGAPVASAFALAERPNRLTWATTAPGMSMVGVYEFDELGPDRTRIRAQESMDAAAAGVNIDNQVLAELIRTWLEGIKAFVEGR
ncbi:SRPBCC family protein [Nocardia sp. NPDC050799]|uniref:SRPBCC family protein n=1 Tax=Nocardia sp. NPDC050799 TaxID=3154842 RepID=UPI0033DB84F1